MEQLRGLLGDACVVSANDPAVLGWSSPTGEWRIGAFEVTDLSSRELLYSKLATGAHLVDDREAFDRWVAENFDV